MTAEAVNPLQAALQDAFQESPIPPSHQENEISVTTSTSDIQQPTSQSISSEDNKWKEEYEQLQASWLTESAIAREKAERNREQWTQIRDEERKLKSEETPISINLTKTDSPSTDIITSTASGELEALSTSRTWEQVPSLPSSFPSFSLRESSSDSHDHPELPPYQSPPIPPSVTFAVFNTTLSTRARLLAFTSSLAINLFLPFINGVMLGFGEIFAKNVVIGYFGWDIPGSGVGVRTRVIRNKN
ncbi:hypothetical protein Clacol_002808 [Clathrus columnatus]|uniref:Uncharacterized protein n=1 Tax=Clathrus columnatus TaxID=1419009 RepID=A0AAV5A769_9AGAM|nr:hypothetical protein Clacol_002808 [Clathrus columnatus]